eukprot:SAG11_NODE_151_length_14583_cov_21.306200_15_plen_71_part_00
MTGESTFFIELSEAAIVLRNATVSPLCPVLVPSAFPYILSAQEIAMISAGCALPTADNAARPITRARVWC